MAVTEVAIETDRGNAPKTMDGVIDAVNTADVTSRLVTEFNKPTGSRIFAMVGEEDKPVKDALEEVRKATLIAEHIARIGELPPDYDLPLIPDTHPDLHKAVQTELISLAAPGKIDPERDVVRHDPRTGLATAVTQYQDTGLEPVVSGGDTPQTSRYYVRYTRIIASGQHLGGIEFPERAEVGERTTVFKGHQPQLVLRREFPAVQPGRPAQPIPSATAPAHP